MPRAKNNLLCSSRYSTGTSSLVSTSSTRRNRTQLLGGINKAATDPMGQLFFAAFDQSQRAAVVFAARLDYLRAGARVVSHQALNHSPRFWRLVESYLPDYRQFDRQVR